MIYIAREKVSSKKVEKEGLTSFFWFNTYSFTGDKYMNQIDPNKYINIINKIKKNNTDSEKKIKPFLINLTIRTLIVIIILISLAIIYKNENVLKDKISNYFFEENISFTKINKFYDKYLGGLLPIKNNNNTVEVFNEKLNYSSSSIYYDGIKLLVSENYLVPSLDEGMVVFIGDKENYGKTIIIENLDGIDFWYGNITNSSLKLYDYVEKGSLVGEVNDNLYMVFSKNGQYLNYEEYIY